jgi:hypothetical protein
MAYTHLEFTNDFPEDGIIHEDGDDWEIIRPSGMAIAIAIAELVKGAGLPVSDPEPDIEHYCWIFAVAKEQKLFWVRVYDIADDERFLQVKGSSPLLKRWFKRRDLYLDLLSTLFSLLKGDPRFGSVRWSGMKRKPIADPTTSLV